MYISLLLRYCHGVMLMEVIKSWNLFCVKWIPSSESVYLAIEMCFAFFVLVYSDLFPLLQELYSQFVRRTRGQKNLIDSRNRLLDYDQVNVWWRSSNIIAHVCKSGVQILYVFFSYELFTLFRFESFQSHWTVQKCLKKIDKIVFDRKSS